MQNLENDTSRGEVKTPTREQFIKLLNNHHFLDGEKERMVSKQYSEDGKTMSFDLPQDIKISLTRKRSVSARYTREYISEQQTIEDYHTSNDYDGGFVLEFEYGKDRITLNGGTSYELLHRFAKALTAITEYERE